MTITVYEFLKDTALADELTNFFNQSAAAREILCSHTLLVSVDALGRVVVDSMKKPEIADPHEGLEIVDPYEGLESAGRPGRCGPGFVMLEDADIPVLKP